MLFSTLITLCDIYLHCSFLNQSLLFLIQKTSSLDLDPLCNVRKVTLTALKVGKAWTTWKCWMRVPREFTSIGVIKVENNISGFRHLVYVVFSLWGHMIFDRSSRITLTAKHMFGLFTFYCIFCTEIFFMK
jgi:hypothetical protein